MNEKQVKYLLKMSKNPNFFVLFLGRAVKEKNGKLYEWGNSINEVDLSTADYSDFNVSKVVDKPEL